MPAALLFFGGDGRQLAWMAALFGMVALYRRDMREAESDAAYRLIVTEEWRGRLVLFAGWLALLLAYQGMQGAEEARVLRRELAMVCGGQPWPLRPPCGGPGGGQGGRGGGLQRWSEALGLS